jgi:hypothetical protein
MAAMSQVRGRSVTSLGLVAVEQYQGIDDLGRCVRAFACNFLQLGSFLL